MPALLKGVLGPIVPDAILHVHLPVILDDVLTDQVHPASTPSWRRFLRRLTTSRWRAHQVGDHQQGPKTAYGEGDEAPLAGPITDRLGYPRPMKCPEVWDRECRGSVG
jgi:hypothetical protein